MSAVIDTMLLPVSYFAVLPYFCFLLFTSLVAVLRGRGPGGDDQGHRTMFASPYESGGYNWSPCVDQNVTC